MINGTAYFFVCKKYKKLCLNLIYRNKLLLQCLATLFFIVLVPYRSSPWKMNILRITPKNGENSRTVNLKQSLITPTFLKKLLPLPFMRIFKLDIFRSKTFNSYRYNSILFLRKGNLSKIWQNMQKIFIYEYLFA